MNPILMAVLIALSIVPGVGSAWGAAPAVKVDPLTIKFAHAGSLTHP